MTLRHMMVLGCAGAALCLYGAGAASAQDSPRLAFGIYGTPGIVDMPVAYPGGDGTATFTAAYVGGALRNTVTVQIAERLTGSFRYTIFHDYPSGGLPNLYDRSFDVQYQLLSETAARPALAVGLRDFGGTGVYGGEYVVATKHIMPDLVATGGIGWGRLGEVGGFANPLGLVSPRFERRPDGGSGTGRLRLGNWFRGDAALFGGLAWHYDDRLTLKAEYSSDGYRREQNRSNFTQRMPFNFGADYRFDNGLSLSGYVLHGAEFGIALRYVFDPARPRHPGGIEEAPPPIAPRGAVAAASWGADSAAPGSGAARLRAALAREGVALEALELSDGTARVRIANGRYDATSQAIGRTARVLANTLPPGVETFAIEPVASGMPLSRVTLQRRDLEELEHALDGSWQSYVRAEIGRAGGGIAPLADAYPDFSYALGAYLAPALFDPQSPVRADAGLKLDVAYAPAPGLVLSGQVRQPVVGNLDQSRRRSDSPLPRVRSDVVRYDRASETEITHLTAEYFFRPGDDLYGRVTAGYLERMFAGVSGEVLWKPVASRLAFGGELNYAIQRDYDVLFGLRDYAVVTGHASAYYDFGNGFLGQVDVGRYLAGDWGATFALDREFANGIRVGAFFTLTDVPFDEFGEGAFDKGLRVTLPLSWLTGEPARSGFATTIRPIQRDGGARLSVRNRLYEVTRGYHDAELRESWGKFWR